MSYLGQIQDLSWASASRIFATTQELFDSQPNYEHEVAIALDTRVKYQGAAPIIGGWRFATGAPAPGIPVVPPPVNDSFTKVLLEFDGIEGSTTYVDTNASKMPRKWTQRSGAGHITNVGEKFYSGALILDGETVITAPDAEDFDFWMRDFTIRGWFLCDFPLGTRRTLVAKSDEAVNHYVFWIDRDEDGFMEAGIETTAILANFIRDRTPNLILDREGEYIISRFDLLPSQGRYVMRSPLIYSDTQRTGWHGFKLSRTADMLFFIIDDTVQDTGLVGLEVVNRLPGPITIGGYGVTAGNPWIGGLDRFAVDIGVGR